MAAEIIEFRAKREAFCVHGSLVRFAQRPSRVLPSHNRATHSQSSRAPLLFLEAGGRSNHCAPILLRRAPLRVLENFLGAPDDAWCLSVRKLARAILTHRFVPGTEIEGDGGLMFTLAVVRRVASFAVIGVRRPDSHPRA